MEGYYFSHNGCTEVLQSIHTKLGHSRNNIVIDSITDALNVLIIDCMVSD